MSCEEVDEVPHEENDGEASNEKEPVEKNQYR